MRISPAPIVRICAALLLAFAAAGCGGMYPYYTLEGSPESRVVVLHVDEQTTEKVPAGSGLGAGITEELKVKLSDGSEQPIEKGKAKVWVQVKGPFFMVTKVEYDGKEINYHEPLF